MTALPSTFAGLIPQLDQFKSHLNRRLAQLESVFPKDDVRRWAFYGIRSFTSSMLFVNVRLGFICEQGGQNIPGMIEVLGLNSPQDLENLMNNHSLHSKIAFVALAQFRVEAAMRKILESYGIDGGKGFYKTMETSVSKSFPSPVCSEIKARLMVPANMRNALHNAGIHNQTDRTVIVNGVTYSFHNGQELNCCSISHIVHIYDTIIDDYAEMFLSPWSTSKAIIAI